MAQFGETYRLSFDSRPFGPGCCILIVMDVGRKWITVADPATLKTGKIAISEWPRHRPVLVPVTKRKMAIKLEKRMKLWRKLGLHYSKKTLQPLAKRLREEST